jgi:hypothetical protein
MGGDWFAIQRERVSFASSGAELQRQPPELFEQQQPFF